MTTKTKPLRSFFHEINGHIGFIKINLYEIKKVVDQTMPGEIRQSIIEKLDEIEEDANKILEFIESIRSVYDAKESEEADG